jgi:Polyketide cyclase / dehydrase and lipid transport
MKIIRNTLIGLVILFALLIIIAFFLPSKKHVEASVLIKAPASVIYSQVDNFANWEKWSPWAVRDSQMVSTYEGPASGVGAITRWKSPNKQTGYGSMKIRNADPGKSLQIELTMMNQEPSLSPWLFEETSEGTKVTWGLDMQNMKLLERYFGLFMQKMMDPYFKQGLDSLKSVSERLAVPVAGTKDPVF